MVVLDYFSLEEFDSPDQKGSGANMNPDFLAMLEYAREKAGIPFVITSGYRTPAHNRKVGGVTNSAHTKGRAADIRYQTEKDAEKIIRAALDAGFKRIGIGNRFIHLDNDFTLPTPAIWKYQNTPNSLWKKYQNAFKKRSNLLQVLALVVVGYWLMKG